MSSVVIAGDVSGTVTLDAPSAAGSTVLTLPATSGTVLTQNPSAPANSFVVDASGNVGIGTGSPANYSGYKTLAISGSTGGNIDLMSGSTVVGELFNTATDVRLQNVTATGPLQFWTNGSERMRIDSSGSIMAGTTTARGRMHLIDMTMGSPVSSNQWTTRAAITLAGNYGGSISLIDGSGGYNIRCDDFGNDLYIQGGATSGGVAGGVYLNNYATSWSSASDENVKDIIEPITSGLDKVLTLRAVIGKYKNEEEGKRHPFLIAQDVQAVLPEAVSVMNKGSENECLGLSYTDTIPLLVASIKELKAELDTVKTELAALKGAA